MSKRTIGLGAAGAAVVLFALGVVLFVPQLVYPPPPGLDLRTVTEPQARVVLQRESSQTALRSSLLQFFGGLLLAAGGAVTWYQVRVNRDGQITDRYSRAVEHLANDNADVRIGGLYVLERISKDSRKDRRFVQVTIGSFVRNRVPWAVGSPDGPEHPTPTVDERLPWLRMRAPDVQTALAILGRRPEPPEALTLRLSRVDLRGVQLENQQLVGADLRRSNLARAWLRGTRLDGCDFHAADLRKASLVGASLRKASLRNAHLEGADLTSADLAEADLHGAHSDATTVWPSGLTPDVLRHRGVIGSTASPPSD
ncbi:hypothetical protein BBK82_16110 [Lentzea guizhouensis]|uniref:Pentapeptide repeat-containing protein n=1 Tax=Lentzea guizhouensis TaxID=1586287 RepID=A0A1B2HI19_9PSEU|nr:pentapeptide repeat-containing protein [Lentzea guizhouensis]ANZ37355.1 hypothetical protein BBK82_16110 [Lentzea guizhouensis]